MVELDTDKPISVSSKFLIADTQLDSDSDTAIETQDDKVLRTPGTQSILDDAGRPPSAAGQEQQESDLRASSEHDAELHQLAQQLSQSRRWQTTHDHGDTSNDGMSTDDEHQAFYNDLGNREREVHEWRERDVQAALAHDEEMRQRTDAELELEHLIGLEDKEAEAAAADPAAADGSGGLESAEEASEEVKDRALPELRVRGLRPAIGTGGAPWAYPVERPPVVEKPPASSETPPIVERPLASSEKPLSIVFSEATSVVDKASRWEGVY